MPWLCVWKNSLCEHVWVAEGYGCIVVKYTPAECVLGSSLQDGLLASCDSWCYLLNGRSFHRTYCEHNEQIATDQSRVYYAIQHHNNIIFVFHTHNHTFLWCRLQLGSTGEDLGSPAGLCGAVRKQSTSYWADEKDGSKPTASTSHVHQTGHRQYGLRVLHRLERSGWDLQTVRFL